jgi:hypothetical protein
VTADALVVSIASALVSIAGVLVAHGLLFHFARIHRRSRALVGLFMAGLVLQVAGCRVLEVDWWRTLCGATLVFSAFILYMPFYYVLATSFSVRMLLEIRGAAALTPAQLRARYPAAQVLRDRAATLSAAGYARRVGDAYVLTPKGFLVAMAFRFVKRLWRLGPGG